MDSGFQVLDSGLYVRGLLGFQIPIAGGILDFLSGIRDYKASKHRIPDSGFHKQHFPEFRNPDFLLREAKLHARLAIRQLGLIYLRPIITKLAFHRGPQVH